VKRLNTEKFVCRIMKDAHGSHHLDLEDLETIIRELRELSLDHPIIVEGLKDIESLRGLGIHGIITHINQGKPLINFCSDLSQRYRKAIILTDWDTKGEILCRKLELSLKACDISFDTHLRERLKMLLRKDVKDIQSIHTFLSRKHPDILERLGGNEGQP